MTSFRQVYYTSCEMGVKGGKGFQILAHSEDMPQPLLRAIEQLAAYSPPRSLPTRPTPDEVQRFPVSLLYQRLKDGTPLIAQNRYVGRDYSGRFGNFFMHALVSDTAGAAPLPTAPINLWGADFWRHESPDGASRSLGRHQLAPAGHPPDAADITHFLDEKRLGWVSRFLGGVETALTTGRRIILVDSDAAVAGWIKLACALLPDELSLSLTFDTYARSPYERDVLLVGTSADSDFRFSPHELEYQFLVFDFQGSRSTRALPETPFSRQVAEACRQGRFAEAARFKAFLREAKLDLAAADLSQAYTYHALESGLPVLDPVPSAQVLRWCASHLASLDGDRLQTALLKLLEKKSDDGPQAATAMAELLRQCDAAGFETAARACRQAFVPWLCRMALEEPETTWLVPLLKSSPTLHHDYPHHVPAAIRAQVVQCNDPIRCHLLLEILDASGLLETRSVGKDLGETRIDLLLRDASVQEALREKTASDSWKPFFEGALRRCEQDLARNDKLSSDWTRFLSNPNTLTHLGPLAASVGATKLQAEFGSLAAVSGTDPVQAMRNFLDATSDPDPVVLGQFYDALFSRSGPTMQQAARIAERLGGCEVPRSVVEGLGAPLLDAPELRDHTNPDRLALARALQQLRWDIEHSTTQAASTVICLVEYIRQCPTALHPGMVVELESSLRWLPDAFMAPTVSLVASTLLEACHKHDAETHRACFDECARSFSSSNFHPVFTNVFRKSIKQAHEASVILQLVANLFATWAPLHRSNPTSSSSFIMAELLPAACGSWNRKSLERVRRLLLYRRQPSTAPGSLSMSDLSILWEDWNGQHSLTTWQKLTGQRGRRRRHD